MTEKSALLKDIQAQDFAVYEAALYLNGHPTCPKALSITNSTVTRPPP